MSNGAEPFDLTDHQRRRIRSLEQEVAALEKREQQLYRIIAAMVDAFHDDRAVGLEYLQRLVAVDELQQELGL